MNPPEISFRLGPSTEFRLGTPDAPVVLKVQMRRYNRSGQAVVEYALVLAFLTSFCVAVLTPWGEPLRNVYTMIIVSLARAAGGG